MKKKMITGLGLVGMLLLATNGNAAPQGPNTAPGAAVPGQSPSAALISPLRIASVARAPDGPNGAFQIDIGIENFTPNNFAHGGIDLHSGTTYVQLFAIVNLAGKTTKHYTFTDAAGPPPCGQPRPYEIFFGDDTSRAGVKKFTVTASGCTFHTVVSTPAPANMGPGNAYVESATIEGAPTCATPIVVKTTVINKSIKTGQGLHVQLTQAGGPNDISAPFSLSPSIGGASTTVTVTAPPQSVKGPLSIDLLDSQQSLGDHHTVSGVQYIRANCNYAFNVEGGLPPVALPVPR